MTQAIVKLFQLDSAAQAGGFERDAKPEASASVAFQAELDTQSRRIAASAQPKRKDASEPQPVENTMHEVTPSDTSARDVLRFSEAKNATGDESQGDSDKANAAPNDAPREGGEAAGVGGAGERVGDPAGKALEVTAGDGEAAAFAEAAKSVDAASAVGGVVVDERTKRTQDKSAGEATAPAGTQGRSRQAGGQAEGQAGQASAEQSEASRGGRQAAQGVGESSSEASVANASSATHASSQAQAGAEQGDSEPLALQANASAPSKAEQGASPAASPASASPSAAPVASSEATSTPTTTQVSSQDLSAQRTQQEQSRETETSAINRARLTRGLASAVNQRGGAVTLRLTPDNMGTVRIQMQLTGAVLSASIHTETASAHQLLTQQLGQLRSVLESQGLTVERLHVQPMSPSQSSSANEQQQGDSASRQHNEGRSRGQHNGNSNNARGDGQGQDESRDSGREPQNFDDHFNRPPAQSAS